MKAKTKTTRKPRYVEFNAARDEMLREKARKAQQAMYLHAMQGVTLCAAHGGHVRLTAEHAHALVQEINRLRDALASVSLAGNDNTAPAHQVLASAARRAYEALR